MSRKRVLIAGSLLAVCGWGLWVLLSLRQVVDSLPNPQSLSLGNFERSERSAEPATLRVEPIAAQQTDRESSELNDDGAEDPVQLDSLGTSSGSTAECNSARKALAQGDHLGTLDHPGFWSVQELLHGPNEAAVITEELSESIRRDSILAAQVGSSVAVTQLAGFYNFRMADLIEGRAWQLVAHSMRNGSLDGYQDGPSAEPMTEEEKVESLRRAEDYMLEFELSFGLIEEIVERACQ